MRWRSAGLAQMFSSLEVRPAASPGPAKLPLEGGVDSDKWRAGAQPVMTMQSGVVRTLCKRSHWRDYIVAGGSRRGSSVLMQGLSIASGGSAGVRQVKLLLLYLTEGAGCLRRGYGLKISRCFRRIRQGVAVQVYSPGGGCTYCWPGRRATCSSSMVRGSTLQARPIDTIILMVSR